MLDNDSQNVPDLDDLAEEACAKLAHERETLAIVDSLLEASGHFCKSSWVVVIMRRNFKLCEELDVFLCRHILMDLLNLDVLLMIDVFLGSVVFGGDALDVSEELELETFDWLLTRAIIAPNEYVYFLAHVEDVFVEGDVRATLCLAHA